MKIKVIIFDFDGVIVDSADLKDRAWFQIFADYDSLDHDFGIRSIIEKAKEKYSQGRGSRFNILREIFTNLKLPATRLDGLIEDYSQKYNKLVQEGINQRNVSPETEGVLKSLFQKYPLYINSATPTENLQESLEHLKLNHYFRGCFGQPASKVDNLRRITQNEGVVASEVLFIGDSPGDYQAAEEFQCHFIALANKFNQWPEGNFKIIHSLNQIESELKAPEMI